MSVNTTVSEFNSFLSDDEHWDSKGFEHYDETLFEIDDVEVSEYDPEAYTSDTAVKILHGSIVYNDDHPGDCIDLGKAFQVWKKAQGVRQVVISVPSDIPDADILKAIKVIGGSIVG